LVNLDDVERDYRAALTGYVLQRAEGPLRAGYEIGRRAVVEGLSMLDLSKIHHEVFRGLLADTRAAETDGLVDAASEFFMEVLATFHMTHGLADERPEDGPEHL
jgi:hypothetical protein